MLEDDEDVYLVHHGARVDRALVVHDDPGDLDLLPRHSAGKPSWVTY